MFVYFVLLIVIGWIAYDLWLYINKPDPIKKHKVQEVHARVLGLIQSNVFSTGVKKIGEGYGIEIVLREPTGNEMPTEVDGVPIRVITFKEAVKEFEKNQ